MQVKHPFLSIDLTSVDITEQFDFNSIKVLFFCIYVCR